MDGEDVGKTVEFEKDACKLIIYMDPFNKRIRVDKLIGSLLESIKYAEEIARENQAEKLIVKGKLQDLPIFQEQGFSLEAKIDQFFRGTDMYFFCKYYSSERRNSEHWLEEDDVLQSVQDKEVSEKTAIMLPKPYRLKELSAEDVQAMALLYQTVFEIYPVPLHDPVYIRKTMEEGAVYYGVYFEKDLVSAAAAEIDWEHGNAELTDCATLPQHRKHQLMKILLVQLEEVLKKHNIYCAYSIARSLSFGMNASLHSLGYKYRGRLTKNCFIFNKLEDMNVWVKDLSAH